MQRLLQRDRGLQPDFRPAPRPGMDVEHGTMVRITARFGSLPRPLLVTAGRGPAIARRLAGGARRGTARIGTAKPKRCHLPDRRGVPLARRFYGRGGGLPARRATRIASASGTGAVA